MEEQSDAGSEMDSMIDGEPKKKPKKATRVSEEQTVAISLVDLMNDGVPKKKKPKKPKQVSSDNSNF